MSTHYNHRSKIIFITVCLLWFIPYYFWYDINKKHTHNNIKNKSIFTSHSDNSTKLPIIATTLIFPRQARQGDFSTLHADTLIDRAEHQRGLTRTIQLKLSGILKIPSINFVHLIVNGIYCCCHLRIMLFGISVRFLLEGVIRAEGVQLL